MNSTAPKTLRERLGILTPAPATQAAPPVVPFPATPPSAPELTDDEREAFAIDLVTDPALRKLLAEQRDRRRYHRLGIEAENTQRASRKLPPLPVPEGSNRPYFVGTFPPLPPREQVAEVFAAGGLADSDIAALILPDERKWLRRMQTKISDVNDQMKRLDVDGIRAMAIEAEQRLRRGKGSKADSDFEKGNMIAARKELRRQKERLVKECIPTLVKIAARIEQSARRALPTFESEATRLKINPGLLPTVMAAAALCYRPSQEARNAMVSPKTWLKQNFGIRL